MAIRYYGSHDLYRDEDDNLSSVVEMAYAKAHGYNDVRFVFGDTTDEGQFRLVNDTDVALPSYFDDRLNARYGDNDQTNANANDKARGNYSFCRQEATEALDEQNFLFFNTVTPTVRWKIDAGVVYNLTDLSAAAQRLVVDINWAINKEGADHVIYSAGGGANVAAEAINYLLTHGRNETQLKANFTIIQHGRNNWTQQYEERSRVLTDEYTLAIDNQNTPLQKAFAEFQNSSGGWTSSPTATAWGTELNEALQIALGRQGFNPVDGDYVVGEGLNKDASDSGSFVFMFENNVPGMSSSRMTDGSYLTTDPDSWFDSNNNPHDRRNWSGFNAVDIERLFDGDSDPDTFQLSSNSMRGNEDSVGVQGYDLHW